MPWTDAIEPARMVRVAVAAPADALRDALVTLADLGALQLDDPVPNEATGGHAVRAPAELGGTSTPSSASRTQQVGVGTQQITSATPRVAARTPDIDALQRAGRGDLIAGEAELARHIDAAVTVDGVSAVVGWCPADRFAAVAQRLAGMDAAVVALPVPRGTDPPTLLRSGAALRKSFGPLVRTYGTVAYADVDPTVLAGLAYVVMFGMMFADAGHGLLLLIGAVALWRGRPRRLAPLRPLWPFIAGAGFASAFFGFLFGEFFGPTGVIGVHWLSPLDEPVRLLAVGVGVGTVLLSAAYVLGVVNRWREGGVRLALYAPSGLAGAALFAGLAALAAGLYLHRQGVAVAGGVTAAIALGLAGAGLAATAGGGVAGAAQTGVQLFDLVLRIGANVVSFARLAAFGLTHAALGALIWAGTTALWQRGGAAPAAVAVALFLLGNAVTFGLEALVAGVQALRLEYYELFSRVFEGQGRPFRAWSIPVEQEVP